MRRVHGGRRTLPPSPEGPAPGRPPYSARCISAAHLLPPADPSGPSDRPDCRSARSPDCRSGLSDRPDGRSVRLPDCVHSECFDCRSGVFPTGPFEGHGPRPRRPSGWALPPACRGRNPRHAVSPEWPLPVVTYGSAPLPAASPAANGRRQLLAAAPLDLAGLDARLEPSANRSRDPSEDAHRAGRGRRTGGRRATGDRRPATARLPLRGLPADAVAAAADSASTAGANPSTQRPRWTVASNESGDV